MDSKPTSDSPEHHRVNVQVPVPAGNNNGPRNLTITLAVSIQVTEIPGVTVGLAGVDLKHAGPVAPSVSAVPASAQQQPLQTAARPSDDGTLGKDKKKQTFFSWKKKSQQQQQQQQQQQTAPADAAPPTEPASSSVPMPTKIQPPIPSRGAGGDAAAEQPPPLPPLPPPPPAPVATPTATAKMPNKAGKNKDLNKDNKNDESSSEDDEIDMTKGATDAGRNTVDSEAAGCDTGENTCGSNSGKDKSVSGKKFQLFGRSKKEKSKGSNVDSSNFNFPQDVPDNVKALFQIMSDTRLMATVYASNAGRTPAVKKQKALLTEGGEKRFTVDGKSRSIWLDPSAGDKVEIWKEYFGDDGECNRALGRLPGTDKYGYILRDEIDEEGQYVPKEELEAYNDSLQLLTMFMDIYGND